MKILDWSFVLLLSLGILAFLFSLLYLYVFCAIGKQAKLLKKKRIKNKKKRKKVFRTIKKLNWQKKKKLRQVFICLLCCSVSTGTAFYLRYYQATNLGARDSEAVAQGYYLINKIEEQLDADVNEEDTSRVQKNIYELSAKLSSFGTTTADGALSKQGQILLNRFYVNMKELGLNLSNHSSAVLESEELYTNYKEDIKKTRNNQKKVFDYFKLNESSFEKSK